MRFEPLLSANRVTPDEWLSWGTVSKRWNHLLSSQALWATAPSFNRLVGDTLAFQLRDLLMDDHRGVEFIRRSSLVHVDAANSVVVPTFQIFLPRSHERKIRETNAAAHEALRQFESACVEPTRQLLKDALLRTETGRFLLTRKTNPQQTSSKDEEVRTTDIKTSDQVRTIDGKRSDEVTIDIKTPDVKEDIQPENVVQVLTAPERTKEEVRDVQATRDFIIALADLPVTADTTALSSSLQTALSTIEAKTPTEERQSDVDAFVAGGGSSHYFGVTLRMETQNATIKWEPNEFTLSEAERVGMPESVQLLRLLLSDAGPYSLRRMLCGTVKCTSKKRFIKCRRFWWHKVQQMRAARELERLKENEKWRSKSQCEKICVGLASFHRCIGEWGAVVCVLLVIGMIATIFMIPFQISGMMSSRWIYIFIPWFCGFGFAVPSVVGFAFVLFFSDPMPRLRIKRTEYWHINGAVRAAQGAEFTDPAFVGRPIEEAVRVSRWQLYSQNILKLRSRPLACLGAMMSVIAIIVKSDGGLERWQWQSILAFTTVPIACGQLLVLISWIFLRWGGPPLDAHAESELRTNMWNAENISLWILLAALWALGAQLDDPNRPLYGWVIFFVLFWILLILDLGLWMPVLLHSKVDHDKWFEIGSSFYLTVFAPILIFSVLLFAHVAFGEILNVLLVWIPLWSILPLLLIFYVCSIS